MKNKEQETEQLYRMIMQIEPPRVITAKQEANVLKYLRTIDTNPTDELDRVDLLEPISVGWIMFWYKNTPEAMKLCNRFMEKELGDDIIIFCLQKYMVHYDYEPIRKLFPNQFNDAPTLLGIITGEIKA
jgi:hypothetical protein